MTRRHNTSAFATDVIIVGAGAAGLRLAQRLKEAEIRTIVLEARNRIGGRIQSRGYRWGNKTLQIPLGAEFVHQSPENQSQWHRILENHDSPIDEIASNGQTIIGSECFHDSHDRPPKSSGMIRELKEKIEQHFDAGGKDMDIASFIDRHPLATIPTVDYTNLLRGVLANEYGEDISRLSLRTLLEPDSYSMKNFRIREGFGTLVRALREGSDIRLNTAVVSIRWKIGRVMVKTEQGSVLTAKQCAISSPIGMLQDGVPAFDPELPTWKSDAISQLLRGRIVKVIMKFREKFWRSDMMFLRGGKQQLSWPSAVHHDKDAAFLAALIGGEEADRLADLGAGRAARVVAEEIMRMHAVTHPGGNFVNGTVTAWHRKEYMKTGYSSLAVGADPDVRTTLQRPIDGTLFWLGEATSKDNPATVLGALESAERASEEIIGAR